MKKIIYCFIVLIVLSVCLYVSFVFYGLLGVGSYVNAEDYIFEKISNNELIEKIERFKEKNPKYKPTYDKSSYYYNEIGKPTISTEKRDDKSIFYSCYFYLPEDSVFIHCAINVSIHTGSIPAILMFSGISEKYSSSWKSINTDDLTKKENRKIKKKFETEILDKLGDWKRDGWW